MDPEKPGGEFWGSCRIVDLEAGILVTTNRTKAQSGGGSWPFGEKPPLSPLFLFGVFWLNIESERWLPGEPTVTSPPLPFFPLPRPFMPLPLLFFNGAGSGCSFREICGSAPPGN